MEILKSTRILPLLEIGVVLALASALWWAMGFWIEADALIHQATIWALYVLSMALIWWLSHRRGRGWRDLGLTGGGFIFWRNTVGYSLIAVVLGVLAFVMGGALATNLGWVPLPADLSGYAFLKGNAGLVALTLLAVYIGSSLGEEVVFRGFLITRLQEIFKGWWPSFWAVLISGLLFGLAHVAWGLMGMIQTAFMGWALGYCYLRFGRNLWVTFLAHMYMDTLLILQMY